MTDLNTRSRLILAVALVVPAVASVWFIAMPQTMTASTYATGAILLVAFAAGALVSGVRKQLKEDNVRTGVLEQHQFDDLLAHLPDELHPPLTFSYLTGWRNSEVQGRGNAGPAI